MKSTPNLHGVYDDGNDMSRNTRRRAIFWTLVWMVAAAALLTAAVFVVGVTIYFAHGGGIGGLGGTGDESYRPGRWDDVINNGALLLAIAVEILTGALVYRLLRRPRGR